MLINGFCKFCWCLVIIYLVIFKSGMGCGWWIINWKFCDRGKININNIYI